jgi:hypothetical protein
MKRAPHKKSIVVPFIVSIIVTVMILLGAEYVFHIPSKFFMTPVAETVIPEKTSWSKTSFTDYS